MINWQSILSSFDDKPTLLEWLKKVQKALNESALTTVTVSQEKTGRVNSITLSFNFQDGTKIVAPAFTVQDGKDGKDGKPGKDGKDGRPGKDGTGITYRHLLSCTNFNFDKQYKITVYSSKSDAITTEYVLANKNCLVGAISIVFANNEGIATFDRLITLVSEGPPGYFSISAGTTSPANELITINSDSFEAL